MQVVTQYVIQDGDVTANTRAYMGPYADIGEALTACATLNDALPPGASSFYYVLPTYYATGA